MRDPQTINFSPKDIAVETIEQFGRFLVRNGCVERLILMRIECEYRRQ